jgi:hypothetical protein
MPILAVFVGAFVAYVCTASPVPGWLDSSELVAASACLGVAHSPGHPIPVLLGRAATLVPVGDFPFRVTLASAAAVAAAAAATAWLAARAARWAAPDADRRHVSLLATATGLAFAATSAAWLSAVRAEVYGLEIALLALALALVLDPDPATARRSLAAAALALGLGLANHHYMTLLVVLPAAVFALARRPGLRAVGRAAALGALGVLAYAHLPLRAARDPLVDWGDPDTPGRLAWTVSARAFTKSLGPEAHTQSTGEDAAQVLIALVEQLSLLGVLALAVGAYVWLRRGQGRRALALLAAVAALAAAGRALLGFDFDNPDALAYLLPAVVALLVTAAAGLAAVTDALRAAPAGRARWIPLALAGALPLAIVATHPQRVSRRGAEASDRYARAVLDDLPPRAVLVTSYFETAFQVWALQAVEGARPDVAHLDSGFHTYPGFEALARRRHPDLAALVDAGLRTGAPPPLVALDAVSRRRPVLFELSPWHPDPLRARLAFTAPLARFGAAPTPDAGAGARADALHRALVDGDAREPGSARVALWLAFGQVDLLCSVGAGEAARAAFARAHALAPEDATLAALGERCKIPPP